MLLVAVGTSGKRCFDVGRYRDGSWMNRVLDGDVDQAGDAQRTALGGLEDLGIS